MFYVLEIPVVNIYLKILRILVAPEILIPLETSAQFERHSLRLTEYFTDPIHKKGFSIYDPVTISNFAAKLA